MKKDLHKSPALHSAVDDLAKPGNGMKGGALCTNSPADGAPQCSGRPGKAEEWAEERRGRT